MVWPKEKEVPIFLNATGRDNYNLLKNFLASIKLSKKSINDLKQALKDPQKVVVAEKFQFIRQAAGESIMEIVAQLRKLALNYDFGDMLDVALWYKFISGLHKKIQRKLLTNYQLTFSKAIGLAKKSEAVDEESCKLAAPVHQNQPKPLSYCKRGML